MKNLYRQRIRSYRKLISILLMALVFLLTASPLQSQSQHVTPDGKGNLTFIPGVRMQVRYEYNDIDKNNDIFIRRMRWKGKGNIFDVASYNFEIKIDNTGRFNQAPRALLEHAWFTFPVIDELMTFRVGIEDDVFSRNALTSDSKLLFMDRSLIKNALTVLGVTDNTVGALIYGRPFAGHLTYSLGIFDNLGFNVANDDVGIARRAQGAMTVARIAGDFLDPANPQGSYDDYQSSYIGEGKHLTIGANVANSVKTELGDDVFNLFCWGVDAFFNYGPFSVEGEYNKYREHFTKTGNGPLPDIKGDGFYVQGAYLVLPKLELALRYQEIDQDNDLAHDIMGGKMFWTSVGANYYIRGHTFKVQAEYTFKNEEAGNEIDNDVLQVQLQLSF
ncbi:MAG: porin [Lewinellaceae bacterium]|nr:porin [Phaeodactylibacter sp.]MCB0611698.1 porin [Phaeodactylibacter sp.]MCB9348228.1 porin [Lewinellaceae bacterium]